MTDLDSLFIVGAGFSKNAGLPLADDFTSDLLDRTNLKKDGPNTLLIEYIQAFVDDAFGAGSPVASRDWPQLEDLFTTLDLAANTGHHLGSEYSASDLRTVRRSLIVRVMRMLSRSYNLGRKGADQRWRDHRNFLGKVDVGASAFLSLNWDTVIETGLEEEQRIRRFDYGCGALHATFDVDANVKLRGLQIPASPSARVLKPHGSVNWLYCDCCRNLLWFTPKNRLRIASRLFKPADAERVLRLTGKGMVAPSTVALCPECDAEALGTRFATFSYRKALDFPMHSATWRTAETFLRQADQWVFIGYSMPAADYEFKHLLKQVQMSRRHPPRIILVTGGGAAASTRISYERFFGKASLKPADVLATGLDTAALAHFKANGIIRP